MEGRARSRSVGRSAEPWPAAAPRAQRRWWRGLYVDGLAGGGGVAHGVVRRVAGGHDLHWQHHARPTLPSDRYKVT